MELFGMGIENILFCYIADEEMFRVEERFADKDLKSTMQKAAERHAAERAAKVSDLVVVEVVLVVLVVYGSYWCGTGFVRCIL